MSFTNRRTRFERGSRQAAGESVVIHNTCRCPGRSIWSESERQPLSAQQRSQGGQVPSAMPILQHRWRLTLANRFLRTDAPFVAGLRGRCLRPGSQAMKGGVRHERRSLIHLFLHTRLIYNLGLRRDAIRQAGVIKGFVEALIPEQLGASRLLRIVDLPVYCQGRIYGTKKRRGSSGTRFVCSGCPSRACASLR